MSGRDIDKIEQLGLETIPGQDVDVPLLKNATGNVEVSVLDSFEFEGITYYLGDVQRGCVTPDGLDGHILSPEADVLAYMGSNWGYEDPDKKYRYYAELTTEAIDRFPEDAVSETLPEEFQEGV